MRITMYLVVLAAAPVAGLCQQWEIGGTGGYGWYSNPSISNPPLSVEAGFPARGTIGAVFGENMYEHLGGEIRWLFRFGGPQLKSDGIRTNIDGYSNVVVYDFLFHITPREDKFRPFVAAGAGIKAFTSSGDVLVNQPLTDFARLVGHHTQTEPAISVGAGFKYRFARHVLVRVDFRTYFSPLPDEIFLRRRPAVLHGWVYDFVPMAGISYVF
jgi:hypothetical protein